MFRRLALLVPAALAALAFADLRGDEPPPLEKGHSETAVPFLKKHCFKCHSEDDPGGELVLLPLADWQGQDQKRALWRKGSRQVSTKQMPPDEEPPPGDK